ncbi:Ataxin-10 [Rhynchospora pubera]|uniref:Ataxin-10 n=1 Tax=Rhynchospora pubera TaxID=906938 RepID=A0AAV8EZC7_9POAL|nr:Ataxin-10 [Rhynchospora pubera]
MAPNQDEETLESLLEASKTPEGRSRLAASGAVATTLRHLSASSPLTLPYLRLLRNLCAGEISSQDSFIDLSGPDTLASILLSSAASVEVLRAGIQVLGNVGLAGEVHRAAVWVRFFPDGFLRLARVREREVCDPLCMVIDTCCSGVGGRQRLEELCGTDSGLRILQEIIETALKAGYREEWLEWLLFKACVEEQRFLSLFLSLSSSEESSTNLDISLTSVFKPELLNTQHAFLLDILSKCLTERPKEVTVSGKFALEILEILKMIYYIVDFTTRVNAAIPTGSPAIDLFGCSLLILRDICAWEDARPTETDKDSLVNLLLDEGLFDFVLSRLEELEPPAIVRKSMVKEDNLFPVELDKRVCPYKGYRRDLVSVIGNLLHRRKRVQDKVREKQAIPLLLQQCVVDEENPYLREWGLLAVRNLLEGNEDNQKEVAELELKEPITPPEISGLGLKVEVDEATKRAKLVNISG